MASLRLFVRNIARLLGVRRTERAGSLDADILKETAFVEIYEKCKPFTMVSFEKSFALYKAVQYIVRNNIEGDFVECGVWKGGQAMLIAYTLMQEKDTTKKIYLYDTYKGMTKPEGIDVHVGNKEKAITKWGLQQQSEHNDWCFAPLAEVQANTALTKYPQEHFVLVEGDVLQTIPKQLPEKIALLRLDTDWYASTYHELVHAYPRLEKKGVLIIDDYGTWEGSRKATDQYMEEQGVHLLLNKIGKSGRIAVKM
jgi:hypothetical protein